MKNIYLFCSGGMSTSLVASKMQKVYDEQKKEVKVEAYDFGMIDEVGNSADIILIAPQISWAFDQVKNQFPDTNVISLTMQEFGSMDGNILVNRLSQEGV